MRWDGTINIGHVLTLVVMLATVIVSFQTLDRRLSVLEGRFGDTIIRIDRQLDRIESKLETMSQAGST